MADQHAVADLPLMEVRAPKSAVITVTQRDGTAVTVSTWSTCAGVGAFVRTFLGEPSARHTLTVEEAP